MADSTAISIVVAARAEAVFAALTEAARLEAWFAEHAEVALAEGRYDFWGRQTPGNPGPAERSHAILKCHPSRLLSYGWARGGEETIVSFELESTGSGTLLTVAHVTTDGSPLASPLADFWCVALQNLRSYVERGEVAWLPDFASQHLGEVRLEVESRAEPAAVFRALTDPGQLARWIAYSGTAPDGGTGHLTVEPIPGGAFDLGWPAEWARPLRILEIEQDRRLVLSWSDPATAGTVVTWELEGSEGGTHITLVHSGFAPDHDASDYYSGWADFLVRLKWLCDEGPTWQGPRVLGIPIG